MNYNNLIRGIALPVVDLEFYSGQEIIDMHIDVLKRENIVYFSTSNRIDHNKLQQVDYVLLTYKGLKYLAKFIDSDFFPNKGVPIDSPKYSPKPFGKKPEKHWLKLSEIHSISDLELKMFDLVNTKTQSRYGNVANYLNQSPRIQVFYFKSS